ncbi:MAG: methylmalonyl-CoA epimerase [Candidatus Dormibacteria bacterium]
MATLESIDHVGIAVADLDAAVGLYTLLCGGGPVHRSRVADDGVEVALFEAGAQRIELLGATRPDSAISAFLARRGGGLHHVAYAVPDVQAALDHYSSLGLRLIDRAPRPGAAGRLVAFLHPEAAGGVLVELCQPAPEPGAR